MFALRIPGRAVVALTIGVVTGVLGAPAPAASAVAGGGFVYVTNRDSGNVSAFAVGPTGRLVAVHRPIPTGAEPRGIVFAPDAKTAYVVSTGTNSVAAFAVDQRGGLRLLGAPVATGGEFAFSIAIAPGGRSLYVSNIGSGTVSAFGIDSDGTVRLLGAPVPSGASDSRGLAVSRDGRFLFVGHGRPNAAATDVVTTFAIGRDGTLRPAGEPVGGGGAGTGMATSPDGRFLYVVSTNADAVFGYAIRRTGTLDPLPGSPFPAADFPEGAAIAPDGRHLYVTSPGPDRTHPGHSVSAFTVGANGALTPVAGSPFTAGDGPVGAAVSVDGRRLYVGDADGSTLSAFTIVPGGALREISGSPIPTGGTAPAFQSVAVLPARH